MRLTNYNTIIFSDGVEIRFNDFIKKFKNNNKETTWISYNEKSKEFTVSVDDCREKLAVSKERLARKSFDPEIRQLLMESAEHDVYVMQKSIDAKVRATGALPVDRSEVDRYLAYLEENHKKTNAKIRKNALLFSVPFVLLTSSLLSLKSAISCYSQEDGALGFFVYLGLFIILGGSFFAAGEEFFGSFDTITKYWKQGKIEELKMDSLKDNARRITTKKRAQKIEQPVEAVQIDDNSKVEEEKPKPKNYNEETLKEIRELVALVDGLSTRGKVKYMPIVNEIITDYQARLKDYLNSPDTGLVMEGNIPFDLYKMFLPRITRVKLDIINASKKEKEVIEYCEQAELLKRDLNQEEQLQRKAA